MSDNEFVTIVTNGTRRVIPADEPVFLIRGQDIVGGDAVRAWAAFAEAHGADTEIVRSARKLSYDMDDWPKKKVPDLAAAEEDRQSDEGDSDEYATERKIVAALERKGIRMMVFGCGCCGSPKVAFECDGVLITDDMEYGEREVNFNMFVDGSDPNRPRFGQ